MLVGFMRASRETDRHTTDVQCEALLAAGVDPRQLCADKDAHTWRSGHTKTSKRLSSMTRGLGAREGQ